MHVKSQKYIAFMQNWKKYISAQASTMLLSKATVPAGGNIAPLTNARSRLVVDKNSCSANSSVIGPCVQLECSL